MQSLIASDNLEDGIEDLIAANGKVLAAESYAKECLWSLRTTCGYLWGFIRDAGEIVAKKLRTKYPECPNNCVPPHQTL